MLRKVLLLSIAFLGFSFLFISLLLLYLVENEFPQVQSNAAATRRVHALVRSLKKTVHEEAWRNVAAVSWGLAHKRGHYFYDLRRQLYEVEWSHVSSTYKVQYNEQGDFVAWKDGSLLFPQDVYQGSSREFSHEPLFVYSPDSRLATEQASSRKEKEKEQRRYFRSACKLYREAYERFHAGLFFLSPLSYLATYEQHGQAQGSGHLFLSRYFYGVQAAFVAQRALLLSYDKRQVRASFADLIQASAHQTCSVLESDSKSPSEAKKHMQEHLLIIQDTPSALAWRSRLWPQNAVLSPILRFLGLPKLHVDYYFKDWTSSGPKGALPRLSLSRIADLNLGESLNLKVQELRFYPRYPQDASATEANMLKHAQGDQDLRYKADVFAPLLKTMAD